MVIKDFLSRGGEFARGLLHLGRLGKLASQRSFLNREKKKFLLKIGEAATELVRAGRIDTPELMRWVGHLDKIEGLLGKKDYGGENGIDFRSREKKSSGAPGKKRGSKK